MCKKSNRYNEGDVLKVTRTGYDHYGIAVDNNEVVHFTGGQNGELDPSKARIRKTSLEEFEKWGHAEKDNRKSAERNSGAEIAKKAKSFIGSDMGGYNLVSNNCEHFARYCENGKPKSDQVNKAIDFAVKGVFNFIESLF